MLHTTTESDVLRGRFRRRLWIERVFWLLLVGALGAVHFNALPGGRQAVLIAVGGQPVTVVASQRDAERLLAEVKALSGLPAEKVSFAQRISLHPVPADGNPVRTDEEAMRALAGKLTPLVRAAAIVANGEVVLGLPTQEDAVRTLSLLLDRFSPPGVTGSVYRDQVKVEAREVPPEKLCGSPEEAIEKISEASAPKQEYEVKAGDSAWRIATRFNVPLSRLAAANPGLDIDRVRLGERIKIPGELPPLTVVARREIEEPSGGDPAGPTRRIRITYENGVEVKREVIGGRRPSAAARTEAKVGAQREDR